ncbi:MAG: alpha/beta hydrolase [Rhodobacteraceae bacterium]|nr:alpha/beta hydrolase [Paracoccaceae bacterium]
MTVVMKPTATMASRRVRAVQQLGLVAVMIGMLAACGTRGKLALVEPAQVPSNAEVSTVIVATSRAPAPPPEYFSGNRDFATNYARFDVSIPPDRQAGTVRYPKSTPDPQRDFVVSESRRLDSQRAFVSAINTEAAKLPRKDRTGVLFVHGFNTNFAEGLLKTVQLGYDLKVPGVPVLFTWPSVASLVGYVADRENALFSRQPLAETLAAMSRTNLDGYNLVAHSMGTFLTMETLLALAQKGDRATLNKINAVILISADIEIDVFRRQAPAVLAAGVPIYLLVSSDDKALKLSAVIRGESQRVGSVRSNAELGGLDVAVVDLSQIKSDDMAGHLKVGTSPELIAFVRQVRDSGIGIFDDQQKVGLLEQGGVLVQSATGVIVSPITN